VNKLSVSLDDIEYENQGEEEEPRGRTRSTSLNDDEEDAFGEIDDDEEEEEEDEEPLRSRSRSRTHLGSNDRGIISVIPGANNDPKSQRSNSIERKEKTGPLTQKEVEVLRKGLEEATTTRNIDQLREEEEEKLAAKEEEEERLGRTGDSSDDEGLGINDKKAEQPRSVGAGVLESVMGTRKSVTPAPVAVAPRRVTSNVAAIQQKYTAGSENTNMRRFKILLLGDSGVGKSSLIFRWNEDRFSSTLVGTVGVNFKTKKVCVEEETVSVQVWDTAGQEQFHQITTSYYRGAHAIMVVYDISDKRSLENVEYWIKNIKAHASPAVHVCLVANKTDLRAVAEAQAQEMGEGGAEGGGGGGGEEDRDRDRTRSSEYTDEGDEYGDLDLDDLVEGTVKKMGRLECIDFATGEATAERLGVPYFETSAKDSSGTAEAFMNIARIILGYERMAEDNDCEGAAPAAKRRTILASLGLGRWGNKDKGEKESKEKDKEKDKKGAKEGKSKSAEKGTMLGRMGLNIGTGKKHKEQSAANASSSSSSSSSSSASASSPPRAATSASTASDGASSNGECAVSNDSGGGGAEDKGDKEKEKEKDKKKWFGFG
jgi:small GTP-binding protein